VNSQIGQSALANSSNYPNEMKPMILKVKSFNRILLFSSLLLSPCAATLPAQAATFSSAQGLLEIKFNQLPVDSSTDTDTDTDILVADGDVTATADANAVFASAADQPLACLLSEPSPPAACNFVDNQVRGEGLNYTGIARSSSQVIGEFLVRKNQTFSFDFLAALELATGIDYAQQEQAKATGSLSFQLFAKTRNDNYRLLDAFSLDGRLKTSGGGDFLTPKTKGNVLIDASRTNLSTNFGGTEENASALIAGSLSRTFRRTTQLLLVETKTGEAIAKSSIPEPSNAIAMLLVMGGGIWWQRSIKRE